MTQNTHTAPTGQLEKRKTQMKKFNEYSSFEEKVLSTLKKKPSDLLALSHKLGEDVTPVNSMLQHLQVYDKVECINEVWRVKK